MPKGRQREAEITKAALFVEIQGQVYQVALPPERLIALANSAARLSDDGALPIIKTDFSFNPNKDSA